jgi:hypothetical protein
VTDLDAVRSRIEAAQELAAALPHLAPGGQTFAIKRIMGLLTDDVHQGLAARLDGQRQSRLIASMDRLAHETARAVPDVKAFHAGITVVLDALTSAISSEQRSATPQAEELSKNG